MSKATMLRLLTERRFPYRVDLVKNLLMLLVLETLYNCANTARSYASIGTLGNMLMIVI